MSREPISADGQDGQVPPPACGDGFDAGARHEDAGDLGLEARVMGDARARGGDGDDFDYGACLDRLVADADAGRLRVPGPAEVSGPVEGLSFIAAGPDELAALGVDGLAGLDVAGFAQGGPADVMLPGTVLLGLAETAADTLPGLPTTRSWAWPGPRAG